MYLVAFYGFTTHIALGKILAFQKLVLNRLYSNLYCITYINIVIQTTELFRKMDFDNLLGFFLCSTYLVKKTLQLTAIPFLTSEGVKDIYFSIGSPILDDTMKNQNKWKW